MSAALQEIARYCRGKNTFGALLLCGEWGSGKTYLLENDLPAALGPAYLLLRISLFGEESLEEIRKKIRREYLDRYLTILRDDADEGNLHAGSMSGLQNERPSANDWIFHIGEEDPRFKMYLQNPDAYIKPEPVLAGRRVILIFDDLERTNLSQVEILGCINEYCENLHIKTIIVANEEKIENRSAAETKSAADRRREFLNYSEMKEKLIEQTVRLHVDEAAVIDSILSQYRTGLAGYTDFLKNSRQELCALLTNCEIRNIRSLRSGLQDFERIYEFCMEEQMPETDIRRIFTAFVLFTMLAKNGRISRSSLYGYGLNRLQQKYPDFYHDRCLPLCLKDSITSGNWDDSILRPQIRRMKASFQGMSQPENRLRSLSFAEIDDSVLTGGWKAYLQMAEEGVLSPDEYLLLIRNQIAARAYPAFSWPSAPDMKKLRNGLERSLMRAGNADTPPEFGADPVDDEELARCTPDERAVCERIRVYMEGGEYRRLADRNQLLAACRSGDEKALRACRSAVVSSFDEELQQAVLEYYDALENNRRRIGFADLIGKIASAGKRERRNGTDREPEGLSQLAAMLRERETDAIRNGQSMKAVAIQYFLQKL